MSPLCKLNRAGIVARDELLDLLEIPLKLRKIKKTGKFSVNDIKKKFFPTKEDPATKSKVEDLDRDKTIAPIMQSSEDSLARAEPIGTNELKSFFAKLVREVSDYYKNNSQYNSDLKIIDYILKKELNNREYLISDPELRTYFIAYRTGDIEGQKKWFPSKLCVESQCPKPNTYRPLPNLTIQAPHPVPNILHSSRIDIVELLYDLDFEDQETIFYKALNEQKGCISFSIAAPCPFTQKWLLNRLIMKAVDVITNPKLNAGDRPPYIVNLDSQRINSYDDFLIDLSIHFKSDREKILEEICQVDTDSPLIFVIRGAKECRRVRQPILSQFWKAIQDYFSSDCKGTKIIIFWIDKQHPFDSSENTENILLLDRLKIERTDIQKWVYRHQRNCNFSENLINEEYLNSNWSWEDSSDILNNICIELKLNGMGDINEWKWTL